MDDVSDARLPAILDYEVTFGTLESDFADMDGDGHVDVVMANDGLEPIVVLFSDGAANFYDYHTIDIPGRVTADIDLGDVDADGDLDMIVGMADYNGAQTRMLINNGDRTFSDQTLTRLPVDETLNPDGTAYRLPVMSKLTKSVDLVDIDNDGDLDLVEANSRGENGFLAPQPGQQNRLYINDGSGFFIDESVTPDQKRYRLPYRIDNTYDIDLVDVDGDGDLYIFAAEREEKNRLLINRTLREMYELYGL